MIMCYVSDGQKNGIKDYGKNKKWQESIEGDDKNCLQYCKNVLLRKDCCLSVCWIYLLLEKLFQMSLALL